MQIERWQSGSSPVISVVIATVPSTDHHEVVERLKCQDFDKSWEVIVVVDDEPTDQRCKARNIGLREANADIVAHTDDDVSPPETWLSTIHSAFDDDIICIEGRVEGGLQYRGEGIYVGCNIAVCRSEALRVGGWNEEYAGWRDDTEFGWRIEEEGKGQCIYRDDVLMRHPPTPRTGFRADQERALRDKYPEKYRERILGTWRKRLLLFLQKRGWDQYVLKLLG
ncbi:glycosyltransferase [Haloferax denitrificans]|uniref:glycosyltransferase n=1 Tax=Haloferax denitrificans TaxID=35745 RepID=UPI003C6F6E18